ncbi:MAG: 4-alpha-glucanotransferase [Bacteroidales bacterium]|nr:4-alpha-glucanotransferase [Bacteroidales bacterium]
MKTRFDIHYHTEWGESLTLVLKDEKYPMQWTPGDVWTVTVPKCGAAELSDYGYILVKDGLTVRTEWERHSASPASEISDSWIDCPFEGCPFPRRHSAPIFDRPGFRGAGTAIPVFSLRSSKGFGIGEFLDLKPLIDWASATGQCIIQLLPVNDTTRKGQWADSYPYSPVSSFALHPMYIRLQALGIKEDEEFIRCRKSLNSLSGLDYPKVFKAKMEYLLRAYDQFGAGDLSSAAYRKFYRKNIEWLGEYCEFCARRDSREPDFYAWVQYHLDKQFSEVAAYAHKKGVYLKGDLPIGVSADSADAYFHPELFNLDSSAGAPPDFFSADGQNWGFPTYNWDEMAKDDYAWWKSRLRKMSEYFDAFRIDHILGFFRIWEIPTEFRSGLYGHFNPALPYSAEEIASAGLPLDGLFHEDPRHPGMYQPLISPDTTALDDAQKQRFDGIFNDFFYHRHNEFWRINAEKKLPELLGATGMLACGEDLGMVPDCVSGVMDRQKILSLEMAMMDKGRPWPYLSVCATSSHDMDTLRMQKEEDPAPWECRRILWEHLESASMLAIFPLQDWLSLDSSVRLKDRSRERINHPENPGHHWRYRMHLDVEELLNCNELNVAVESLLKDSFRFNR